MKLRYLSAVLVMILAAASGSMLFHTAQGVQQAEKEQVALIRSIAREKQTIRVLKAEWAYLNRPGILEKHAKALLGFTAPETENIGKTTSAFPHLTAPLMPPPQKPEGRGAFKVAEGRIKQ